MSILAAAVVGRSAGLARLPLVLGIVVLWGAATPILSDSLGASLEWRSPPVAVQASPSADAIVVLGGAVEGARPPRCTLDLSDHADRVLHAARLYRAGKAPLAGLRRIHPLAGGAAPGGRIDTGAAAGVGCAG